MSIFNISVRRVGGLTWVRIGRLTMAFNVNRGPEGYQPLGASGPKRPKAKRYTERQLVRAYERGYDLAAWKAARGRL